MLAHAGLSVSTLILRNPESVKIESAKLVGFATFVIPSRLMNKKQVAEELGVSVRSVENYVKRRKLSVRYEKGATSDVAVFEPSEVRRLKAELQTRTALVPTVTRETHEREARKAESMALAVRPLLPERSILPPSELVSKLLLTLTEAVLLTGLSRDFLSESCRAGRLRAFKRSGWHVRPEDLRKFIQEL